ncbi:MAG: beta-ketoacyl-[acyl-carrier-protein] synthase family protein [Phycisphaerae bacterium]
MPLNKVVITGVGAISPFGIGVKRLMASLNSGCSAVVNRKDEWQASLSDLTSWVAAPLRESLDSESIPRTVRRSMGRVAQLAYVACLEALARAHIPPADCRSRRMGVSFASTMGSTSSLEEFFAACFEKGRIEGLPANTFFRFMSHTCAANLAHALNLPGRVHSPACACASSLQAIGCAVEAIKGGYQEIMLCGGADELHVMVTACFDLVHAASSRFNDQPTRTPRPFDRDRDGIVCGEGAGALVLESERSASERGAEILGEVIGYATTSDGSHIAQPHRDSIVECLRQALDDAGVPADAIDYVNAHATGTLQGDREEAAALKLVFGERGVPVSSFKGHLGHTLGASGALELIACLCMQEDGYVIPTLNLEIPGEGCEDLAHVMTRRRGSVRRFVKNNFAFGGVNAVLVVRTR